MSLLKNIDENKIIPIIRQTDVKQVPIFLKTKLYIDFSKKDDFEFSYDELVRAIHHAPLFEKPPVGDNPFVPVAKEKLDGDINLLNRVLTAIVEEQGIEYSVNSKFVVQNLKISEVLFKIAVIKLIKLGYVRWTIEPTRVTSTEKGLFYVHENNLIKYN